MLDVFIDAYWFTKIRYFIHLRILSLVNLTRLRSSHFKFIKQLAMKFDLTINGRSNPNNTNSEVFVSLIMRLLFLKIVC